MRRLLAGAALTVSLVTLAGCGAGAGSTEQNPEAGGPPSAGVEESTPPSISPAPEGVVIEAAVRGGAVKTTDKTVEVALGQPVELVVTSDESDEIHVHGYNRSMKVAPGNPARLRFTADVPGIFDVEAHRAGLLVKLEIR